VVNPKVPLNLLVTFLLSLALVACGGGDRPVLTGHFTDSPVQGLQYRTASQSGETDATGGFKYLPGETVTFFVGDIPLGEVVGASMITPFDIAGISPPEVINSSEPNPLAIDHAVNLAVFLQTLDADGDPSNGIVIPTEIRTLTSGLTLDFKLKSNRFSGTLALRKLVGAGQSANLWGGVRAIRTTFNAIKSMYTSLGISPPLSYRSSSSETVNLVTGAITSRIALTYDANGYLIKSVYESDVDGVLDKWTMINTFDANGDLRLVEYFNRAGVLDNWIFRTFDVNGNVTRQRDEFDNNGDGVVDRWTTTVYSYDANGYPLLALTEVDNNTDGTVDSWSSTINTYDTNGNLTMREESRDGAITARYTATYASNGKLTISVDEYDINGDGKIFSRATNTFTYDANGITKVMLTETDTNADGTVDKRRTVFFDAKGQRTVTEYDNNADGVVDRRTMITRDVNGNITMDEDDTNADGTIDLRTSRVYAKVFG
jgi:hypothetical protein